jgi:hypothetical protein
MGSTPLRRGANDEENAMLSHKVRHTAGSKESLIGRGHAAPFFAALMEDYAQHGRTAVVRLRRQSPAAYLRLATLFPKQFEPAASQVENLGEEAQERRILQLIKEFYPNVSGLGNPAPNSAVRVSAAPAADDKAAAELSTKLPEDETPPAADIAAEALGDDTAPA